MKKVLIGMSGGVDSSVAAALLKDQGYDVTGATMLLWNDTEKSAADAKCICDYIGIDFIKIDFKEKFRSMVIDYFVDEYIHGRTPNPCIMCNKYLKFGAMLDYALKNGFDYIATGHYGKIIKNKGIYELHSSEAAKKDQSYFLYNFTQHVLSHTIMPLGDYCKEQVREIAAQKHIPTADKPDSQEICFVADDNYVKFICDYSGYNPKKGKMLDINGNILGEHQGLIYYTIGQRKGLGAFGKPMFVMDINDRDNTITLGEKGMEFSDTLFANNVNYISGNPLNKPERLTAKVRYQAEKAPVTVYPISADEVHLVFDTPQRAVTPGQAVVFYDGDKVVGGGTVIKKPTDV